jgi:pilus assembly protein FimV
LSAELDQETEIALSEELPDEGLSLEGITETEQVAVSVVDTEEVISDEILDEAVEAFSGPDELADNLGDTDDFDFLDGTDEASTKLDLARAYIDMGDVDGAKDILGEVAKEGSEEQQAEANDLLGSLDV